MRVWIRTQDRKGIFECKTIYVDRLSHGENVLSTVEYGVIGKYDTEERCLEILDEIQNLLTAYSEEPLLGFESKDIRDELNIAYRNTNLLTLCAASIEKNVEAIKKSTVIYQMPEK